MRAPKPIEDERASTLISVIAGPDAVWVHADAPLQLQGDELRASFVVSAGQKFSFVLTHRRSHLPRPAAAHPLRALRQTREYWKSWLAQCRYSGRWRGEVRRTLILLKALTFAPTGGIVAAATTSLPEQVGGVRNWDYRYCWLRDATFTLQAFLGTAYVDEAKAWREWLVRAVAGDPAKLQIMYGLDGTQRLPELTVDWLDGYAGSTPVRVGNAAANQHQLDVWGEVLDGLYLTREAGLPSTDSAWALQRALCTRGYDPERNTFTQFHGSRGLDASLLLIPRVGILPWDDVRVIDTVEAVAYELDRGGFLLRYDTQTDGGLDGLPGDEGAFLACSFWLVDALHGIGHNARAEELFQRLLRLRNDVGMHAEECDSRSGRHLGNTPQAFSLVGLVNSARHLSDVRPSDSRDPCT